MDYSTFRVAIVNSWGLSYPWVLCGTFHWRLEVRGLRYCSKCRSGRHHAPSGMGAINRIQHALVGQSPSPGGGKFGQT